VRKVLLRQKRVLRMRRFAQPGENEIDRLGHHQSPGHYAMHI
jgi:hypothetical protein